MQDVFVSFETHVDQFRIAISKIVTLKKIKTIILKTHMKALSCGPEMVFTRNDTMRMICTPDFSVKYSSTVSNRNQLQYVCSSPVSSDENPSSFISASFHSDKHAVIVSKRDKTYNNVSNELLVVDKDNKELFKSDIRSASPLGLAFDLKENIFVCQKNNQLLQIKYGGWWTRYIQLPDIIEACNVVLHPTGEKVLVLDGCKRFCVYKVL